MSHFTVLVTNTDKVDVDTQLEPFDENRNMPKHISITREEFIERGRKDVEHAKKVLAKYEADPRAYEKTSNPGHLKWVREEAPGIAKMTDEEELFKLGSELYESELDEDGNYWSTRNEDAKWDWYQVGGRWAGFFVPKKGASGKKGELTLLASKKEKDEFAANQAVDVIRVGDIDWDAMDERNKKERAEYFDQEMAKPEGNRFIFENDRDKLLEMTKEQYVNLPQTHSTFAVLHEGRWYERGQMGWWGIVTDEKDQDKWDAEWRKLVEGLDPDAEVTVVDCHI